MDIHPTESEASLDHVLKPASIAVVGASRTAGTIGHQIVANLIESGFAGPVFPVNPRADSVRSVKAYRSVSSLPQKVDLAVIAVPCAGVLEVVRDCAASGVRAAVVISAGFREMGEEGAVRERNLVQLARSSGMRLVGPNCLGVVNADPDVSMNATFAPGMPPGGDVAFVSQSGALGLSVLDYASELGIGISQFVSLGNKADVSGNDLLQYWETDDKVRVVLMYVEDFGNPLRFLEIAQRVTKTKPVIAMKSGRSRIGARAASSHTGSLAASDTAVDALLAQAGVMRATSIEELFDMAMAFEVRTLPRNRRVAVVTNSGGPGIVIADALEPHGIELVELSDATIATLHGMLPPEASVRNPLDMIATATPATYRGALTALLNDENVGSVIAIFVPPLGVRQEDVAEAIVEAALPARDKPVLAVLMGRRGLPQGRAELYPARIPAYIFPESAARALATLVRYREWRERAVETPPLLAVDRDRAARIIAAAVSEGRARLSEIEALELIAAYGIPVARATLVRTAAEAALAMQQIGGRAVMKVVSPDIVHKTDVGGVETGLSTPADGSRAFEQITKRINAAAPKARITGMLVQPFARSGREIIVGMTRDPQFGPLVMFGLGGVYVEALRDVTFRVAPLARNDAADMIRAIRGHAILEGIRGQPPVRVDALEDTLLRVSQLAIDFPQIAEMDINPLMGYEDGVLAVDCRFGLEIRDGK
jgi:acetyltransferase